MVPKPELFKFRLCCCYLPHTVFPWDWGFFPTWQPKGRQIFPLEVETPVFYARLRGDKRILLVREI